MEVPPDEIAMKRTIFILHPGAIGDVLLAVPAIRQLKSRFPGHQLLLCARESVANLLSGCGEVHNWISVESRCVGRLFGNSLHISGELASRLNRCDLAVAWMQDQTGSLAVVLESCGVRETHIESPFSPRLLAKHQQDRLLETIGEPGTDLLSFRRLKLSSSVLDRGAALLQSNKVPLNPPLIIVHPGSGSRNKCVGSTLLASAVGPLQEEGFTVALLEGPADHESIRSLVPLLPKCPTVIRESGFDEVAGILAHAGLFIGQDSGMTHLSALLGIKTVALFGPTDPERWAPRGKHVTVLGRRNRCRCESWDDVGRCSDKPCFGLSADEITEVCLRQRLGSASPRNPRGCALSPPTSYARVAS